MEELKNLLKKFGKINNDFLFDGCKNCEENSCIYHYIKLDDGKIYPRNNTCFGREETCHDCNILNKEGNYHHFGCDMEICPLCKKQLISCNCIIEGIFKS
ncbi:MAG: hypothetical protein AABW90_04355 [Nanoarchaeota archaeon]